MKLPQYPKYRPSGTEWLENIPTHWVVKRGRFCMEVNPRSNRLRVLNAEDEVSFVPMEAVGEYGGLKLEQTCAISDFGSGYTEFDDGDVVVAKITPCFENGKGALATGLANGAAFGTTELHVLRAAPTLDRRFLFHFTISSLFRSTGEGEMYGAGGQKRVPPEFCQNIRVPLPPPDDQACIADFLDRETVKIDMLMAKKRTLIERLKEKRTALISRSITRGLPPDASRAAGFDPHPKLKPSGIDWLGEVPEHWEVKKLRYLCTVQTGDKDTVNAVDDGEYPFYVRSQTVERIDSFTFDCEAVLTAGDGVGVGKVFHHHPGGPFDFHQRVYMMSEFRHVIGRFFFYFLREQFYKVALEGNAKSTVDSLRRPLFMDFQFTIAPLPEQTAIAAFLDKETAKLDALVAKVETAIERLQEYRTALITAAVTGKIDVRRQTADNARETVTAA